MAEATIFGLPKSFYQRHIVDQHVSTKQKEEFTNAPGLKANSAQDCVSVMLDEAFRLQDLVAPLERQVKEQVEQLKEHQGRYEALNAVFGNLEEAVGAAPRIKEYIQKLEEAQGKLGQARQAEVEDQNREVELQRIDAELATLADKLEKAHYVAKSVTPLFEALAQLEEKFKEAQDQFQAREERLQEQLVEAQKPTEAFIQLGEDLKLLREEYEQFKEVAALEKKDLEQRIDEAGQRLVEAGNTHDLALEQLGQQKDEEIRLLKEAQRLALEQKDQRIQELEEAMREAAKEPNMVQKNKAGLYDQIVVLLNPQEMNGVAAVQQLIQQYNNIVGFFDRLSVTLGLATQEEMTNGTINRNAVGGQIEAIADIVFRVFNGMYRNTVGVLLNLQAYERSVKRETRMINEHPGLVNDKARLEGEVRGLKRELAGAKARSETLTGLASSSVRWTFTAITGVPRFMWEVIQG